MKITIAFRLALLSALMVLPGCPHPVPGGGHPGLVDCTVQSVRDHGIELIPKVNDCLAAPTNWTGCLLSLVQPALGITEDVVACVTKSSGSSYASSATINPNDLVSREAANHAREFIQERGYVFAPGSP